MISSSGFAALLISVIAFPLGLSGQAGLQLSVGSRSYHSGPTLLEHNFPTYKASGVSELRIGLDFTTIGSTRLNVTVNAYHAGFGLEGGNLVVFKHKVSGYGVRLGASHRLFRFGAGPVLAVHGTVGVEWFSLSGSPTTTSGVIEAGPALQVPLTDHFRLDLAGSAGTTLANPYPDESLPDDVRNGLPWWTAIRVGLRWQFH